jgi:ArsR family transcriptional regulator
MTDEPTRTAIAEPVTEAARLAVRLKALAHPARLEILRLLAERGTCVCGAIVEVMPLAQATVSQHLKVLKEAGLVRGTIDGPRSCYCIDRAAVAATRAGLDRLLAGLDRPAARTADNVEGRG